MRKLFISPIFFHIYVIAPNLIGLESNSLRVDPNFSTMLILIINMTIYIYIYIEVNGLRNNFLKKWHILLLILTVRTSQSAVESHQKVYQMLDTIIPKLFEKSGVGNDCVDWFLIILRYIRKLAPVTKIESSHKVRGKFKVEGLVAINYGTQTYQSLFMSCLFNLSILSFYAV